MIDEKKLIEYLKMRAEESKREWERFDDHGAFGEYHAFSSVIDYVNSMPKSREWIPVSERLPENSRCVLITDDHETFATDLRLRRYIMVTIGFYEDSEWWFLSGDCTEDVTAWMELPEPYRGDTDDRTD